MVLCVDKLSFWAEFVPVSPEVSTGYFSGWVLPLLFIDWHILRDKDSGSPRSFTIFVPSWVD